MYISSIAAIGFGRHMKGIKETDPAFKSGIPYNDAKLDAEKLVMSYHTSGRIACTIIRPANVTGPGSAWVRDIVEKMIAMPMPLVDGAVTAPASFMWTTSWTESSWPEQKISQRGKSTS